MQPVTKTFGRRMSFVQHIHFWREVARACPPRMRKEPTCRRKLWRPWKRMHPKKLWQGEKGKGRENHQPQPLTIPGNGVHTTFRMQMAESFVSSTPSPEPAQILVQTEGVISANIALEATSTVLVRLTPRNKQREKGKSPRNDISKGLRRCCLNLQVLFLQSSPRLANLATFWYDQMSKDIAREFKSALP